MARSKWSEEATDRLAESGEQLSILLTDRELLANFEVEEIVSGERSLISASMAIERLAEARRIVAEAKDIEDIPDLLKTAAVAGGLEIAVKRCRDRSDVARAIATDAAEIQKRAERRIGELLIRAREEDRITEGGRPKKTSPSAEPVSEKLSLDDLGIDKKVSSRCQAIASVPEEQFEAYIDEKKADPKGEITTAGILRLAPKRPAKTEGPTPIAIGDGKVIQEFVAKQLSGEEVICPHFIMLKWANGCAHDCAWCYLKGTYRGQTQFREKPWARVFGDLVAAHEQVEDAMLLNAGEVADGLGGESADDSSALAILGVLAKLKKHRVLFLTKSADVEHLLAAPAAWRAWAVLAWSVNAEAVAKRWEKGAPGTHARLAAARAASEAGYEVRLRIDPIVPIEGWREEYRRLVEAIEFKPSRVTLGTLRMVNRMILSHTWDGSWADLFAERTGWGAKLATSSRVECYRALIDLLAAKGIRDVGVCKETRRVVEDVGFDSPCNCEP